MPEPRPLLCTPDEVRTLDRANTPALQDDDVLAEACIGTAQDALAAYLGYDPAAHLASASLDPAVRPVRAQTVGPVTLPLTAGFALDPAGRLVSAVYPVSGWALYVSGWRTAGETDEDLVARLSPAVGPTGAPLTAADVVAIPEAPTAVRSALAEAALALAIRFATGGVGVQTKMVDIGTSTITSERVAQWSDARGDRLDEVRAILASRCSRFRHVHV